MNVDGSGFEKYHQAVEAVLMSTIDIDVIVDALLVRAAILLQQGQLKKCEEELSECIIIAPDDAAVFHARSVVRGNSGDWTG